ncbi:MAG: NAD(P)-dependent alcohol dehydrogenase [Bryobacterales bacterium]|nr:NAD(P)-dependent alcohol dehydrogenase [Bryobacterales bacterium]
MRSWQVDGSFSIDGLKINDSPGLTPEHGEVVIQVKAVSLNFRDLLVVKGLYSKKIPQPLTICSDAAGTVAAVGPGVTRFKIGDRVMGIFMQSWISGEPNEAKARSAMGAFFQGVLAEQVKLSEDGLVAIPGHLTDEEASTLPCAAVTAWNALFDQGHLQTGDTVLVQGSGGVSVFALQFAAAAGARVIATTSSDVKAERLRKLGANHTINYITHPDWEEAARKLTAGRGVDHIVEIGGAATIGKSIRAARMGGSIYLIGNRAEGQADVNLTAALMKAIRIQGIFVGSRQMFEAMNRVIDFHKICPVVDRVFSFDEAREALRHFETGSHFGKVVIRVC